MKLAVNIFVILSFIYFLHWNNQAPNKIKSSTPQETADISSKSVELRYAQYLLIWQSEQISQLSPWVSYSEDKDNFYTHINFNNYGQQYSYTYAEGKQEVKTQSQIYPIEVILMENNKVVFQFSGNLNKIKSYFYEDLEILAYFAGEWEINLIPFAEPQ